jgi:hypothetical protein
MSEILSKLNVFFFQPLLNRLAVFTILQTRLFRIAGLLFLTAAFGASVSAQPSQTQFSQGFETDNSGWFANTAPPPARVVSGTSGIPAKTGGFYAQVAAGDPNTFTRWGGYNSVFPVRGYTTSVDVYLDVSGGYANDTRADFSSAVSDANPTPAHRRDFVFNFGFYNDAGPFGGGNRFVFSASNNSPGNPRDPARSPLVVSATGWYTLKHRFYDNGAGVLAVEMSLLDAGGATLGTWTLSDPTDVIGSTVGGNRYGWLVFNQFSNLAIDNARRANYFKTLNVDDDGAASDADCNAADLAFMTIQSAINDAGTLPGDIVNVCPGTYIEDVNINKANLTLSGSGAATTTISGAIGGSGITVQASASNAEIRNFTITRQGNNTTDWNNPNLNSVGVAVQGLSVTGLLVHDNVLTGNRTGIDVNNSGGHTIRNNVIDFNRTGLIFRNQTDNITFVENFLTNNWTVGILFLDASGGSNVPVQSAAGSLFSNNNISGNWFGQIVDRQSGGSLPAPGTTNLKEFRYNWLGTSAPIVTTANSAEPGYAAQIPVAYGGAAAPPGGQPDLAGQASANIRYSPVLANGIDTNVETAPGRGIFGFQGSSSVVPVKASMLNGWSAVSQRTAAGSFVVGPGAPPFGFGSYRMTTGAGNSGPDLPQGGAGQGGKTWIATQYYDNTRLANITRLGYSTYVTASPSSAGNAIAPSLQFQIDLDGNGTRDSAMIFEPVYSTVSGGGTQPNVALGQWQTWNARTGRWWFNNSTVFGCGQCAFPTFDQIVAAYPNARIVTWFPLADGYGTQFQAGQDAAGGAWTNFDGNIDGFNMSVSAPGTTFDFEPERPAVTINQAAGQADPTSTSPINFTVAFGEPVTGFDASDVVLSGTAGAVSKIVTGGPAVYNVAVGGMTGSGTVIAIVPDSAAASAATAAPSTASTSTDNTVTYFTCNAVSIPTGLTVLSGNQFVAPINVDDTTGRGILSFDFTVTYNPAVVTPVAVETAGTLGSGLTITTNTSSGTLVVSGFGTVPLSGAGVLVNLRFVASGGIGSTSNLGFSGFQFNEGIPCVNTSNGNVTVVSGTIGGRITYANALSTTPVPNTAVNAAGSIPLSTVTDASGNYLLGGFGAGPYTLTPAKTNQVNGISNLDASTVAQHVVGLYTLNATQLVAGDVSGNGTISSLDASYIAQYVVSLQNPSSTGTWRFIPSSRSYPNVLTSYAGQDYGAILMGEVTGNWNPGGPLRPAKTAQKDSPARSGQFLPPIVTVNAPLNQLQVVGSSFTVPLTVSNTTDVPPNSIDGYEFDLLYSQSVIVPQASPCDLSGTISSGLSVFCNAGTPGIIKVVVFGTMPLTGSGTLFKFKFTAVGAAGTFSNLMFQNFQFDEGAPGNLTIDGKVTITPPVTAASVSVGGRAMTKAGQPLSKIRIALTNSQGEIRYALSNAFGFYRFEDVAVGQTYVVSGSSKLYTFSPEVISPTENLNELNLVAAP